ncbi:2-methylfumaryl-CoA isomerase [Halieaceae bacterium IMCC14734]|uniref:2-methylfumaryl-CoA isomerase n=1 Tax=Candidatus Litorirhabdus singularis TaxID=2518993 RepID=A0ABT3TJ90_9GAMM|nr:CoA transferase [Candidatus Litorirhabdus singularis]MCX2982069.1 2-methylfumaryl-CoA isomerase [Candidatus Litorirhabdus singularis]
MQKILSGMRVVEGSAFVAAPSGGMTLAQLGADVIRFDPLQGGIDYRRWPVTNDQRSLYWHSLNKGKRSIAVDFRQPEGKEILTRLITLPGPDAGLFLTNFPARGWLADEKLRAHREDLIYLNLTGDRHGGSALDYTVNSKVGFPLLTGEPGSEQAINNPLPAWDVIAGQHIALGLLAAERHRTRTGKGQLIKLALADVALATVGHLGYIAEAQVNGAKREPIGNHIYGTFGRDFCCSDGKRVMIVGVSPNQWQAIETATGISAQAAALADSQGRDFSREGDRYLSREALAALIEPWFAQHSFAEAVTAMDAAGVCWGEYQSVAELVANDPDCSVENPLFDEVEQPGIGSYLMPGNPLGFGDLPREPVVPAPLLGQHTDEILADTLGLSSGEIATLHDRGIVMDSAGSAD